MIKRTIVGVVIAVAVVFFPFISHVSAVSETVTLFSDNFDQSGNGLTNNWGNWSGASNGARDDAEDEFTIGASGKGLRLQGSGNSNSDDPDDGSQRNIATKGYAILHVGYSRMWAGNGLTDDADTFVSAYSFDDADFVEIENKALSPSASHASVSFEIPNPDRHSKLTLRFYINGDKSGSVEDTVGIDDIEVSGENPPLFYDGFESGAFGDWTLTEESPTLTHTDSDVWTDDNDTATGHDNSSGHDTNGHAANIDGSTNPDPDDAIIKNFDATGYENIKIRYARKTSSMGADDQFKSMYSGNGGESWSELETLSGNHDYESKVFSLDAEANDNSSLIFRFEVNADAAGDNAYVDDVVIWGDALESTGKIAGTKFKDTNGDGENSDESGLAGWEITLTDGEGVVVASATTDENGNYAFEELANGTYKVCETMQDGWTQTAPSTDTACSDDSLGYSLTISEGEEYLENDFGNFELGQIHGYKFHDWDIDGEWYEDFENSDNSEPALAGWTIYIDANENAIRDEGESYDVTDENGAYTLNDLKAGTYLVREEEQEGWQQTAPNEGYYSLGINQSGNILYDNDFGNVQYAQISVEKIADPESGTFTFNLVNQEDESTQSQSITIGEDDSTTFEELLPGTYTLEEVNPEGWEGSTEAECSVGDNSFDPADGSFEVAAGDSIACTYNNTEFAVISGRKFEDENADGVQDRGEVSIVGWTMALYTYDSELEGLVEKERTQTDEDGNYSFASLEPGDYYVCEELTEDWYQSYPSEGYSCPNETLGYELELEAGQLETGVDFGNYQNGSISGAKFNDTDGDGDWDENEAGISGWTLRLYQQGQEEQSLFGEQTTGEGGTFSFLDIPFGDYVLSEVSQDGWTQTFPASSSYALTINESGQVVEDRNFGNRQPTPTPSPTPSPTPTPTETPSSGGGGGGGGGIGLLLNTPTPTPTLTPTPTATVAPFASTPTPEVAGVSTTLPTPSSGSGGGVIITPATSSALPSTTPTILSSPSVSPIAVDLTANTPSSGNYYWWILWLIFLFIALWLIWRQVKKSQ